MEVHLTTLRAMEVHLATLRAMEVYACTSLVPSCPLTVRKAEPLFLPAGQKKAGTAGYEASAP